MKTEIRSQNNRNLSLRQLVCWMAPNRCQIAVDLEIRTKMANSSQNSAKWNFWSPFAFKRKDWQTSKGNIWNCLRQMEYVFSNRSSNLAMNPQSIYARRQQL